MAGLIAGGLSDVKGRNCSAGLPGRGHLGTAAGSPLQSALNISATAYGTTAVTIPRSIASGMSRTMKDAGRTRYAGAVSGRKWGRSRQPFSFSATTAGVHSPIPVHAPAEEALPVEREI